jgi:guanylate kinase
MLFVISAPSGAGKTTIIKEIFKLFPNFQFSISSTTRKKRNGEQNGKDYYFLPREEFEKKIKNNDFVEWEVVHGEYYGTPKNELEKAIKNDSDIILDIDVKGAISIKKLYPESITIFINAPRNEIIERLKNRKTESSDEMQSRIERMDMELGLRNKFDFTVSNESKPNGINYAVGEIKKIIEKKIKNIK